MKHRKKISRRGIASVALSALFLVLSALLLAVPVAAEGQTGKTAIPFYLTPIGMTAILAVFAAVIVCIVLAVRAAKAGRKETQADEPTVIKLEPRLPDMRTTEPTPKSFAEDLERMAQEEWAKEDQEQKRAVNRAINEVLFSVALEDRIAARRAAQEQPVEPDANAEIGESTDADAVTVVAAEVCPVAQEVQEADISADLADRVERRWDRFVDADGVDGAEADPQDVKRAAYVAAFEEAQNLSADAEDAIDLTDEEPAEEEDPTAEEIADISGAVSGELAEELEQSEPVLNAEQDEVEQLIADIRDSVLAEGEEPIELTDEVEKAEETAEAEEAEEVEETEEAVEAEIVAEEPTEDEVAAFAILHDEEPENEVAEAVITEEAEADEEDADEAEESDEADEAEAEVDEAEDPDTAEDGAPAAFGNLKIVYIDAKADPEAYAALLEQEKRGEVTLVYRYRKSFLSKLTQAQDNVKEYYSTVKNALLSYKGVKSRTSWGYEAFNQGRNKLVRMDVKPKALYLYLAIDPQSLVDTKYTFKDVSEKKKYAATPVLFKIRGDRKLKHALELIERICGTELQLRHLEVEPTDYRLPSLSLEEQIDVGYVKMMVGAVPVVPEESVAMAEPEEPAEQAEIAEEAILADPTEPAEAENTSSVSPVAPVEEEPATAAETATDAQENA